ncbi:MAG: hypothetical protein NUV61_00715 [Candidatus Azambacteria bacterium]|nr:hypothetical protein [Candidatus Azambacteria bacterium]
MSEKHFGEIEEGDELEKAIQEAADSIPDEEELKEEVLEGAVNVSEEELQKALDAAREREEQGK